MLYLSKNKKERKMKLISAAELVDEFIGKIGTPKRDAMEAQLPDFITFLRHHIARIENQ